MTMIDNSQYARALHGFLALMITAMSWMMVQLYGNLHDSVGTLDTKFVEYTVRASDHSRGADEKLGQYMLIVEKRLAALTVRGDYLEAEARD